MPWADFSERKSHGTSQPHSSPPPRPSSSRSTAVGLGKIVHVVGHMTDEVFSFLGPATSALAGAGVRQVVVTIDKSGHRRHLTELNLSAEVIVTPNLRGPVRQWLAVQQDCRIAFSGDPLRAVHVHGLMPYLVGIRAMRAANTPVPIFYSPHGSGTFGSLRAIGVLATLLVGQRLHPSRSAAIVNVQRESRAFERWKSAPLVENSVGDVFFAVPRCEAPHPLIVTGGRNSSAHSAGLLAQLAVLLSGEAMNISFNWIGTVDADKGVQLAAAKVAVIDVDTDAECAARLAAGWVYLAPGSTQGFPLFLVDAMAAGLPCVALDCAQHREVIRDGETGFLCRSEHEIMSCIATLIDNPALRTTIGRAARAEATRRFGKLEFGAKLLAAYGVTPREIAPPWPALDGSVSIRHRRGAIMSDRSRIQPVVHPESHPAAEQKLRE